MSIGAPVSARRAQTQERLMDAALTVIAERGVVGASVEQICEQAGFTRGAFYSNFDDKDELLIALLRRYAATQQAALRAAVDDIDLTHRGSGPVSDELLDRAISTFLESQPRDLATVLTMAELRLYAVRAPVIRAAYAAINSEVAPVVADVFTRALAAYVSRLIMPVEDALRLLQAVYEQNRVDDMLDESPGSGGGLRRELKTLLLAMIVPASD